MNIKKLLKQHPVKQVIKNFYLKQCAKNWAKKYKKGDKRFVNPPEEYKIVFQDNFKTFDQEVWRISQTWGEYHPNFLDQYYDTTGELISVSKKGLSLGIKRKPKTFYKKDNPELSKNPNISDEFEIPVCVGLVNTKIGWQYGWFESTIKLPRGQHYWPAFWLSGLNHWPPEIDIFEAYTDLGPNYDDFTLFNKWFKKPYQKIQPNLHYGEVENKTYRYWGAYNIPVAQATERFVQWVCHWEKDFIRIYWDGILVFEVTDKKVLQYYNRNNDQMHIILNHGLNYKNNGNPDENPMVIRNVKVFQKK
jgi:beta-glucanase (GH16 family)